MLLQFVILKETEGQLSKSEQQYALFFEGQCLHLPNDMKIKQTFYWQYFSFKDGQMATQFLRNHYKGGMGGKQIVGQHF